MSQDHTDMAWPSPLDMEEAVNTDASIESLTNSLGIESMSGKRAISVNVGQGGGNKENYTAIIGREGREAFDALYNFVMRYPLADKFQKIARLSLMGLGRREITAPGLFLEKREKNAITNYETARQKIISKEKSVEQIDQLNENWMMAHQQQLDVAARSIQDGVQSILNDDCRYLYFFAALKMRVTESAVRTLSHDEWLCFVANRQIAALDWEYLQNESEGVDMIDHSQLLEKLANGEAALADIVHSLPWSMQMAYAMSTEHGAEARNDHLERMNANGYRSEGGRTKSTGLQDRFNSGRKKNNDRDRDKDSDRGGSRDGDEGDYE